MAMGKIEDALTAYNNAEEFAPDIVEIQFWHAITLADLGRLDEAIHIFQRVFKIEPVWRDILLRLPPTGMLKNDPEMIKKILQ